MSAVVVVGSANLDFTVEVARAPQPGETILGRDLMLSFGGKGANQAVAARRAGAAVTFVGKVGGDQHGNQIRENLESIGIDASGLISDPSCRTGVAFIVVDPAGGNQIVVVPGCNYRLTETTFFRGPSCSSSWRRLWTQSSVPSGKGNRKGCGPF